MKKERRLEVWVEMKANHIRGENQQLPQDFWEEGDIQRLVLNPF